MDAMDQQPAPAPTADEIDREYTAICSRIGEAYLEKTSLRQRTKEVDAHLAHLIQLRAQVTARYQQAILQSREAPLKIMKGEPARGK